MPRLDDGTPYFAIGNSELAALPRVAVGDRITCKNCAEIHTLEGGKAIRDNGDYEDSDLLLFFSCGGKTHLGAIKGALLNGHTKAAKENVDA